MSHDDHAKRRKTDGDGGLLAPPLVREREEDGVAPELMSVLNKLLQQNCSMQTEIKSLREEVKSMKCEMTSLREEVKGGIKNNCDVCDAMEGKSLQQGATDSSSLLGRDDANICRDHQMISRLDDVENRQKYHEVLLKNHKWEYSAPNPPNGSSHTVKDIKR